MSRQVPHLSVRWRPCEKIASFLEGKNDPEKPKDEQLFQEVFTVAGFDLLGGGQKSSGRCNLCYYV